MNGISFLKHIEIHTTLYCICLRRWYFWLETRVIIKIEFHLCQPIIWPWFSFSLGWNRFFFWIFELNGKKTNPYSPFWKNPISLIHQFSIKQFKKNIFSSPWKSGSNGRVKWMELKSLPWFPAKKNHLRKHVQYSVLHCFLSFAANDVVCT